MTQRVDLLFCQEIWHEVWKLSKETQKFKPLFHLTQRIELFLKKTHRIEFFFWKKYDSQNWTEPFFSTWLKQMNFFFSKKKGTQRIQLFFFECDSKNWIFSWAKTRKNRAFFFWVCLKELNMTQRIEFFF